ncbi:hypothetical protein [Rubripirellula reticaptiva]|uniref:Uncharacterized protein n=1 Tax=Rubripirellula reticaptiva TaxID=2528013 RepID=A0A5C6FAV4_9BACT|nr:hypothetical protein [Rubripirellula reticaptiva]TWU57687.1 hypothetical protein Poly59_05950 [Rubripirellula reticaptiva]
MNMSPRIDRLAPLVFVPPAMGMPWTCAPVQTNGFPIRRSDGSELSLDSPLFWFDPPWDWVDADSADVIAESVAQRGIVVSALRRDLSDSETPSALHVNHRTGRPTDHSGDSCKLQPLPRIVPYRPERYGLCAADFDGASIVDVRLTVTRDDTGRFAYSPEQIKRWEQASEERPLAGGSWAPAATFPPDIPSMDRLHSKLNQIRMLSPSSAVFVSISPYRLDQDLPQVIQQKPDGVILRADDVQFDGLTLVAMTRRARQWMKHENVANMPLWIVPGDITPDDAVKLIALGASGVAIDSWCNAIIESAEQSTEQSTAARMGFKSARSTPSTFLIELVQHHLEESLERFDGLSHSILQVPCDERLASLDANWANSLGLRHLAFGVKS